MYAASTQLGWVGLDWIGLDWVDNVELRTACPRQTKISLVKAGSSRLIPITCSVALGSLWTNPSPSDLALPPLLLSAGDTIHPPTYLPR
jgi:hypothetical protein